LKSHSLIIEIRQCFTHLKENQTEYIFGFIDKHGNPYDYHVSDDMNNIRTWESIEFKFSLPDSKYILVWRRDRNKISNSEANKIIDYVKDDMHEYMTETDYQFPEGVESIEEEGSQSKISSMLLPSKDCLIIAYDRLTLPAGNINWKNFSDLISFQIDDMIEEAVNGNSDSEKIEDILEGRILDELDK